MKKLIVLLLLSVSFATAQEKSEAETIVQKQVESYNARDLDSFLTSFSEDVIFYNSQREINFQGKEQVREKFGNLFKNYPDLHCHIENRIVSGNTVIDHEKVTFSKDDPNREFIIMYKISEGKITEVHSLKR